MHGQARRRNAKQYTGKSRRERRLNRYLALGVVLGTAIPTRAEIINVPGDQPTIQAGVDAAVTGDEVVVAPGDYVLGEFGWIVINSKNITLRSSGGADATTIYGGGTFPVMALGLNNSIIQGFTITNGTHYDSPAIYGGGITIIGGSPTILDCIFIDNVADERLAGGAIGGGNTTTCTIIGCTFINNVSDGSGAIFMDMGSASATISDCTFQGNSSTFDDGGAVSLRAGTIENSTFTNNTAAGRGGAVYAKYSVSITGCTFIGNRASSGGGVHMAGGTVTDCTFESNIANSSGGGAWLQDAFDDASVTGCTFSGNSAGSGAGLLMSGGEVTDCTFDANTATGNGGGAYASGTSHVMTQCTFRGNTAGDTGGGMYIGSGVTATLTDTTFCQNMPGDLDSHGVLFASGVVLAIDGAACDEAVTTLGACSLPDDRCVSTTESSCLSAGGAYQGDGATCDDAAPNVPGDFDVDGDFDLDDLANLLLGFTGPLP